MAMITMMVKVMVTIWYVQLLQTCTSSDTRWIEVASELVGLYTLES
jgi:hypothetical protein